VLEALVSQIAALETTRGTITRQQRAALRAEAQPYQDAINAMLFGLAGLNAKEIAGIESRLQTML
jgi:hypothetical protein